MTSTRHLGAAPGDIPPLSKGLLPLYDEAVAVADVSPASACALLRMLVQALVKQAGGRGRNLTKDLNDLAGSGLDVGVLRALDAAHLTDSHARRPAELDLTNGHSEVQNLSVLVHVLARSVG